MNGGNSERVSDNELESRVNEWVFFSFFKLSDTRDSKEGCWLPSKPRRRQSDLPSLTLPTQITISIKSRGKKKRLGSNIYKVEKKFLFSPLKGGNGIFFFLLCNDSFYVESPWRFSLKLMHESSSSSGQNWSRTIKPLFPFQFVSPHTDRVAR